MKTIRMEQIRSVVQPLLVWYTLFSNKPDEADTPNDSFVYMSIVSDNITNASFQWYMMKEARVSFTIVCKTLLWVWETEESVLFDIIDELNTIMAREACNKIDVVDTIRVREIESNTLSPIFYNQKNRAYIVKDFIFKYEW